MWSRIVFCEPSSDPVSTIASAIGMPAEEVGAAVLRHASQDAEHEVGFAPLARGRVPGLADGLLLGGVAHAARVEQEDVAVVLARDDPVSAGAKHRRDGLAVALVHLAPVSLDVDPVHRREGLRNSVPKRRSNGLLGMHFTQPTTTCSGMAWQAITRIR
jgi:hypothetical protein